MSQSILVRFGLKHGLTVLRGALIGKWRMSERDFSSARMALDTFQGIVSAIEPKAARIASMIVFERA